MLFRLVGAHLMVNDNDMVESGHTLVKIPRKSGKAGDITGGLPRVTELFEARNPSNPSVVSEIDGVVSFGKIKRGNREIIVESKTGDISKYLVKLSNQILVQENDFIKAGMPLSDGATTPSDILRIKGPSAVQEYLVNEIQEVYRLQGVKINDKHFEVVVRQMMRKVKIIDSGDTLFLENQLIHKIDFIKENDAIYGMKVVEEAGDSENLKPGQIVSARQLRDENSLLRRNDQNLVEARDAKPATAEQVLQGITRASLQTKSFISAQMAVTLSTKRLRRRRRRFRRSLRRIARAKISPRATTRSTRTRRSCTWGTSRTGGDGLRRTKKRVRGFTGATSSCDR